MSFQNENIAQHGSPKKVVLILSIAYTAVDFHTIFVFSIVRYICYEPALPRRYPSPSAHPPWPSP
eukprot:SAG31_NODE_4785_length_2956_cov_23.715086_4_plen_65_part_00